MAKNDYIESLDIPESDKALLRKFAYEDWANIIPEKCVSEKAREEAYWMARHAKSREEYSCGID